MRADVLEERGISLPERFGMIADDLTGACDTGVMFARHGCRMVVLLDQALTPGPSPNYGRGETLVLSTDSRADSPDIAAEKTRQACQFLQEHGAPLLYKKIDSVLRGNIGAELEAALQCGGHPFAVIAPAFPAMGRRLVEGILRVDAGLKPSAGDDMGISAGDKPLPYSEARLRGLKTPVQASMRNQGTHLPSLLTEQGLNGIAHLPLALVRAGDRALRATMKQLHGQGARYLVMDAETDSDLDTIAKAALHCLNRPLLVGSGGLAAQVALQMYEPLPYGEVSADQGTGKKDRTVVLFIGSTHPVTAAQIASLVADGTGAFLALDANATERLRQVWETACIPIFAVRWSGSEESAALEAIASILSAENVKLLISGGDTATYLCRIWGAEAIALEGEILTGLPQGRLVGGLMDGIVICTKSGGFGAENALHLAVEILNANARMPHAKAQRRKEEKKSEGRR